VRGARDLGYVGLQRAGRCFGMHHADQLVGLAAKGGSDLVWIEDLAPRALQAVDVGADPRRHIAQPLAKIAVDTDQDVVARLDEVDQCGLHPCTAGA